jgi:lysophospholipase L1-like esterase
MKLLLRILILSGAAQRLLLAAMLLFVAADAQRAFSQAPPPLHVAQYPELDELFPGRGPLQKGDWFKRLWVQRRSEWWQNRERDRGAVVFLGDSITQGWSSLAAEFPALKVANRGISGDTTRGVRFRLKEDVLDLEPAAIVLLIGTNDIGLDGEPGPAAHNVKAILSAVKTANPRTPVVVCRVMPSDASKNRPPDKIKKLNALVEKTVKADRQFILCDTWSIFADENGNSKAEEFPDLLHPNAQGYAKWAEALRPILAKLKLEVPQSSAP